MSDGPETQSAPAPERESVPDYEAIIARWFNVYVANSPVSRSVEAVNHLTQVAIPALAAALKGV